MNDPQLSDPSRILLVDDTQAIHDDFRKILIRDLGDASPLDNLRAELFGSAPAAVTSPRWDLVSAFQGAEAITLVEHALAEQRPFAMAFVDVRMPPGLDGIETVSRIWRIDPDLQVVICTAYSDYSWPQMIAKLGQTDRLVILKKPFDPIEVLQLANAMTRKWSLLQETRRKMDELESVVHHRTIHLKNANEMLEREIAQRKRREHCLTLQQSVTSLLAEFSGTHDEVTDKLLAILCQGMRWDFAQLWMADPQSNCLRATNGWRRDIPELEALQKIKRQLIFSFGQGLPGQVWKSGQPVWIANTGEAPELAQPQAAARAGLHSAFAFPLRLRGKVLGVMEFLSAQIRQPEDDILQLFATMGSLIGQALERRALEDHLRHSQKMEAIGQLAGGVAHDFNNMLTVIQGFVQILKLRQGLNDAIEEGLGHIDQAASRAANLTRQLLTFSRKQNIQPAIVDLNNVISNLSKMLGRLIGEDIALTVNCSDAPAMITADEDMLGQVLMNLAVNSRDAMPKGGQLQIQTESITLTPESALSHALGRPGQFIRLSVTDSGCGISPEHLPRIFEPFFTTKDIGRGTGLGLSTVYGIVQQHQGWIEVNSQLGAGTSFRIYFPQVAQVAGPSSPAAAQTALPRGTETVLLVEDEPAVRSVACILLQRLGYKVIETISGKEALDIWKVHGEEVDLVLTDMVMPDGLNGRELIAQLQLRKPDLKYIFASGYNPFHQESNTDLIEGVNFLQKPYKAEKLAQAIRRMLDRKPAELANA